MPGETIRLVDSQGGIRDVPVEAAAAAMDGGWTVPTGEQEVARVAEHAREANYGGVGGALKAGLAGAARGVTLGGSDVLARAVGGENAAIALEGLREENPGISVGTEIGGALGASILTAGAATPAGLAARAGRGITELGAEAGTLGKIGYGAIGGAAEGALYGAGAGASELVLSQDPLTLEHAASALSSNMLFGGLTGGVAGAVGKAAELGMVRAKGAIDAALARKAIQETAPDLASMNGHQLGVAERSEIDAIRAAQAPEREQFIAGVDALRQQAAEERLSTITSGVADRQAREAGKVLRGADFDLRRLTNNKIGLVEKPERALNALQTQRQALGDLESWLGSEMEAYPARAQALGASVRDELLAGKIKGYVPSALSERGKDLAVEQILKTKHGISFLEDGSLAVPEVHGRMEDIQAAIGRNEALQQKLSALTADPTSERLTQIAQAKEALHLPKETSLGSMIMGAGAAALGPMGAVVATGSRVIGGLKKAAAATTRRVGEATSSFLGTASKAAPYVPVVATKILAGVRYAPGEGKETEGPAKGQTLAKLFKARTDEIKSQTAYDELGVPRLRPAAHAAVADRLKPVRAVDPILADRLETLAAKRIEFLSSLIPRRPDIMHTTFGPDLWQPSDMAMRSWARSASAVEDPDAVLERAVHGAVSPEDAAALQAVYPEKLADFTQQVAAKLPMLRKTLPYARRISLSILTGQPVDPAMDPAIMRVFQAQFQYEPEPPKPEAQFGSVKARELEPATASQRREEGTA